MKIRKTLRSYSLQSKLSALMIPRSRPLEKLFSVLEKELKSDQGLRRIVGQLSITNNRLASVDIKEHVAQGMDELQAEGWVKSEEVKAVLDQCIKS